MTDPRSAALTADEKADAFGPTRQREIRWYDPSIYLREIRAGKFRTGLEMLRAIQSGELPPPPIAELLDYWPESFDDGEAIFVLQPQESHYSPLGMVHGGVIATLMDTCVACAVHTKLPINVPYTTAELKVNFVRAVRADSGPIRCVGRTIHVGRSTAIAAAEAKDSEGRLVAHATTTCLVLDPIT